MVFHRARPWRARRPAFGTRAGTRLRGTPLVMSSMADAVVTAAETPLTLERPPISVLGIRRRYWEMTHGWKVPVDPVEAFEIDTPDRVA